MFTYEAPVGLLMYCGPLKVPLDTPNGKVKTGEAPNPSKVGRPGAGARVDHGTYLSTCAEGSGSYCLDPSFSEPGKKSSLLVDACSGWSEGQDSQGKQVILMNLFSWWGEVPGGGL